MVALRRDYGEKVGQKHGRWTIIAINLTERYQDGRRQVECQCECGTKRKIPLSTLFRGKSGHCGCQNSEVTRRRHDRELAVDGPMIGRRFHRLVVLGRAKSGTKAASRYWECQCDCGNKTNVTTTRLKTGWTKSCGCFHKKGAFTAVKDGVPITVSVSGTTTPFKHGVYFWYDVNDCIVYVGKYSSGSRDPNMKSSNRPWNHIPEGEVIPRISIVECPKNQIDILEQHFIMVLNPRLNKKLRFSKVKIVEMKPIEKK